jgi:hypothetical protein
MAAKILKQRNGVQLIMTELRGVAPSGQIDESHYAVIAKWKTKSLYEGTEKEAAEKAFNRAIQFGFGRQI